MGQPYRRGYTAKEWGKWLDAGRVEPRERVKLAANHTEWTWELVEKLHNFNAIPKEIARYSPYLKNLFVALGQNESFPGEFWDKIIIKLASQKGHQKYRDWDWLFTALEQPRTLGDEATKIIAQLVIDEQAVLGPILQARYGKKEHFNYSLFRKTILNHPDVKQLSDWNKVLLGAQGWTQLWPSIVKGEGFSLGEMLDEWYLQSERADNLTPTEWLMILDSWKYAIYNEAYFKSCLESYVARELGAPRLAGWSRAELTELLTRPTHKDFKIRIWSALAEAKKEQQPVAA